MERTTTREGELLPGREAEALCRLSRLETMMEDVLAEEARLSQQLSALRLEGKTKTARFRELLGQKPILSAMTGRLRGCGALPMKEPAENSCNDLNGLTLGPGASRYLRPGPFRVIMLLRFRALSAVKKGNRA